MLKQIRPALVMIVALTAITGLAYPLAMTGIAQAVFPRQANGSLIEKDGKIIGSSLIGQNFTSERYFHGRPSATVGTDPSDSTKTVDVPYNAANSGGSNLGATNRKLIDRIQQDAATYQQTEHTHTVPVDAVTTSGSGLDPDISLMNAMIQAPRIAATRHYPVGPLRKIIRQYQNREIHPALSQPTVNVLALNRALDRAMPVRKPS